MIELFKDKIPMFEWADTYFIKGENTGVVFMESDTHGIKEYHILIKSDDKNTLNLCLERVKTLIREMDSTSIDSEPVYVGELEVSMQVKVG